MEKTLLMLNVFNGVYGAEIRKEAERTGQDFIKLLSDAFILFIGMKEEFKDIYAEELYKEIRKEYC